MADSLGGWSGFTAGVGTLWGWVGASRRLVQAIVVLVVALALPVVLASMLVYLGLWLTVWRIPTAERADVYRLRRARTGLKQVEGRHAAAVRVAEKALAREQRQLAKSIRSAERELAELKDPKGRLLASYQGCLLHEMWISTPQGSGPVDGATAACDSASNLVVKSRATLTRMAAGGLVLGPLGAVLSLGFKKHKTEDHRELYLLVEATTFASVTQCPSEDGLKARQFAAAVTSAGLNAGAIVSARPAAIAAATDRLDRLQVERGGVPAAERALEAARKDPSATNAVAAGRRAVAELEAARDPES